MRVPISPTWRPACHRKAGAMSAAPAGGGASSSGSNVAAAAGRLAVDGAKATAQATQRSVITISTYVSQNPTTVKLICCLLGLLLSIASVLSMFNIIGNDDEDEKWDRSRTMQSVYIFFFGLLIFFCELREDGQLVRATAPAGCRPQLQPAPQGGIVRRLLECATHMRQLFSGQFCGLVGLDRFRTTLKWSTGVGAAAVQD